MGLCIARQPIDEQDTIKNGQVELQLEQERLANQNLYKLLLLGPGESGKSTFFKQMVLGYGPGFTPDELDLYCASVRECVMINTYELGRAFHEVMPEAKLGNEGKKAWDYIMKDYEVIDREMDQEFIDQTKALWRDEAIQSMWNYHRSKIQVPEAIGYFMNKRLDAIIQEDYVPTEEDMMQVRIRTSGIIECKFTINGTNFLLVDVGGQRSERKKWIKCFDDVKSVLFLCAVSEYDQVIFEDEKTNRVHEALDVFQKLLKEPTFENIPFVVFFNKMDLFRIKIENVPLSVCFPDYDGPMQTEEAMKFLSGKFQAVFEEMTKSKRKVYMHQTQATDRENCIKVFDVVRATVIQEALHSLDYF